ncbi:MAG: 5-methyltetrahydropteroyltriglutamate--homocysteine S-methyltransferase [Bradyrhizobiaceae bacterium]|nr:5-methyltetrahydropteroyltriglutamate--homocysteine S-methyltransferase [Bradyrhizobiaceae bacterium]
MHKINPPFRAEHVGSFLRPQELKDARAKHERGALDDAGLKAIEDKAIERVIRQQEENGLQSITDGEFRRAFWHYDFLQALKGVETYYADQGIQFKGAALKPIMLRVKEKLGFSNHPMVEHFRFVQAHAKKMPKMTIPSPTALHFRFGRKAVPEAVYPKMEDFYRDLGAAYAKAVRAFADAGCEYLQLDEVYLAYLCDPEQREGLKQRGEDPETLPKTYAKLINDSIAQAPADMLIGMHLCRGNFRSTYVASGGYEPVAEVLFNDINVHAYFMEFDTERAGGFEPLRFVPKNKTVVLGLITSKTGKLEAKDEIKRRIDQAAKFVPMEQLCLSPQCGFSSTEEGNLLSEDEQWRKIRLVREIADEVWG